MAIAMVIIAQYHMEVNLFGETICKSEEEITCRNCGYSGGFAKSSHIMEYYKEKSRKLYGKENFWLYVFFEHDVKPSPLFCEEKMSKQTSYILRSDYNEIQRIVATSKPQKSVSFSTPAFRDTESEAISKNIPIAIQKKYKAVDKGGKIEA